LKACANLPKTAEPVDVIVVGAGFAGLYAVHHFRSLGFTVQAFEAGTDVGGTWYWNRYPGARCDVESVDYSYSFSEELQQDFDWSERYAGQPEILRYMQHVATRFDLYRSIRFDTRISAATYDDSAQDWHVQLDNGDTASARFLILATGALSVPLIPNIPGLDSFQGKTYQTARWPVDGVDFTGQRVAVIGTGSSGIQSIPVIAQQAEQLFVFQRTPNFSIPAHNKPMTPEALKEVKANYTERRRMGRENRGGSPYRFRPEGAMDVDTDERAAGFEHAWQRGGTHFAKAFSDLMVSDESNQRAVEFVHSKIGSIVTDAAVADALMPKNHPLGSKRICTDTDYYETFTRENVTLIDVQRTPLTEVYADGIRTTDGDYPIDALVLATGFDAMTGSFLAIDIRGSRGLPLRTAWSAGPRTYLGLAVVGFPNLFMVSGPGSPSVLTNMVAASEHQVDWLGDCLVHLRDNNLASIEAEEPAQDDWVDHVNAVAQKTLYMKANSWYLGANVPGKPRIFLPYVGGFDRYQEICAEVAAAKFRGFQVQS
jgi:cation diffusion facilitator CzcD-associated flavoprotein CzcO